MRQLREWILRLWGTLRRGPSEREWEEEMRVHLELAREASGLSGAGAQRDARLKFGGVEQAMEAVRDQRRLPWIEDLTSDLRYGARTLRRSPGFALLAVAVMALGIGANTAVFNVVNAVLLKPLAYRNPERIVLLTNPPLTGEFASPLTARLVAIPNFQDWRDQSSSFEAMAFYYAWQNPVMPGPAAEYAQVAKVSPEFFRVFDLQPLLGRFFSADEAKPGSPGAILLSYAYWQTHFAGDPNIVGRTMRRYNLAQTIVGVLPPGFRYPDGADMWIPDNDNGPLMQSRAEQNHYAIGRLKAGVPIERAQTEMAAIAGRLAQQYPETNQNRTVAVTRMRDDMVSDMRLTLYLLLAAVGVVLLIACANTATLLLGKATARNREIAVRAALGAGRRRIARQLLAESLLLASVAGALGLLLAFGGSKALIALAPAGLPRLEETGIDGWVLAFTIVVSLITSVLFGLAPALYGSKPDLNDSLKRAASRSVTGGGMVRMRGALVVAEIALSVVLLAGAGLLIKSFVALHNVALGFRPENVLVMKATGPGNIRDTNLYFKDVLAQISAVPGVVAAGATMSLPGHVGSSGSFYFDHLPGHSEPNGPSAAISIIAPGTFAALGIPLKSGRDFNDGDTRDRPMVAIVNEALAREAIPGQDPLGRSVYCGFDSQQAMTVVGVVGDVRERGPARPPIPECYMPNRQHVYNNASLSVVVRTTADPVAMEDTLRRISRQRAAEIPVTFTTMERDASQAVAEPRFRTLLFGLFAGLAICLAMAGVYGVMAFAVSQRSNEIGVRMALGASSGWVLREVLKQALVLAAIGLAIGLILAVVSSRVLTAMLFEVKPNDPWVYAAVSALLGAVTILASLVPAWKASRVDPVVALREE